MANAPMAGINSGTTIWVKTWKCEAPSIAADFEQVARQLRDVVVEQEYRQRQPEAGVRQPDTQERPVQTLAPNSAAGLV